MENWVVVNATWGDVLTNTHVQRGKDKSEGHFIETCLFMSNNILKETEE